MTRRQWMAYKWQAVRDMACDHDCQFRLISNSLTFTGFHHAAYHSDIVGIICPLYRCYIAADIHVSDCVFLKAGTVQCTGHSSASPFGKPPYIVVACEYGWYDQCCWIALYKWMGRLQQRVASIMHEKLQYTGAQPYDTLNCTKRVPIYELFVSIWAWI